MSVTVPYQGIDFTLSASKSQFTGAKSVSDPTPVVETKAPSYLDMLWNSIK